MTYFNGVQETIQDVIKHYDELGGPNTYGHYAAGWAVAGDTTFTWTKQVASSCGGTRNGMVVFWPKAIKAKNEVRKQWHHVIDIAPTILEAAGVAGAQERERHASDSDRGDEHGPLLRRRRPHKLCRHQPAAHDKHSLPELSKESYFQFVSCYQFDFAGDPKRSHTSNLSSWVQPSTLVCRTNGLWHFFRLPISGTTP